MNTPRPEIIEAEIDSAQAIYGVKEGRTFIIVDRKLSSVEKRCAIAHELGHDEHASLLNELDPRSESERMVNRRVEYRADKWAALNLIPQAELEEYLSKQETVNAYDLAEHFEVTEEVAEFRMRLSRL